MLTGKVLFLGSEVKHNKTDASKTYLWIDVLDGTTTIGCKADVELANRFVGVNYLQPLTAQFDYNARFGSLTMKDVQIAK